LHPLESAAFARRTPIAVLVMQADTFRRVSLLHLSSQFYGVEIGQVRDEPLELRGGALLPESCETVHVAIDSDDTEALFKQAEAHRATKPLRRSGDKNGAVLAADKRPSTSSRSSIVAF
jgi:hypothetical protein